MCEERERLIDFVYEECDPADRRRIERHLDECAACRGDVSGLRAARQDLLAWDVPARESVWRPFAPQRPPWSGPVPVWALAAAAALVMAAGGTGALMTRALGPASASVAGAVAPPPAAALSAAPSAVTIDALERRMMALQIALEQQAAESTRGPLRVVPASATLSAEERTALLGQVRGLLTASEEQQLEWIQSLYNDMSKLKSRNDLRYDSLRNEVEALRQLVMQGR